MNILLCTGHALLSVSGNELKYMYMYMGNTFHTLQYIQMHDNVEVTCMVVFRCSYSETCLIRSPFGQVKMA